MKFSINKFKSAFGKKNEKEHSDLVNHTETIINDIDETPFALSDNNVMYAAFSELGGYHFMQTIIIGSFKIKTLKGAQLKLSDSGYELQLDSDMTELTSDHSHVPGRSITRIDFQIEETDTVSLEKHKPSTIVLTSDKKTEIFKLFEKQNPS